MGEKLDFAYVAEKFMHARNILEKVPNRRDRFPKAIGNVEGEGPRLKLKSRTYKL